jgi:hypothetical protein
MSLNADLRGKTADGVIEVDIERVVEILSLARAGG